MGFSVALCDNPLRPRRRPPTRLRRCAALESPCPATSGSFSTRARPKRSRRKISAWSKSRFRRRAGAGRGAPPLSLARSLHARPAERREVLRRAAAARRDDGRRHGRRGRRLRESALQAGDVVVGMGGWQRLCAERRARPATSSTRRRSAPGLSRRGRHARRHGLVRASTRSSRRRRARRCSSPRRPARSARWSASSPSSPGARAVGDRRRRREMRLCDATSSATTPASTTSRRASPTS